MEVSLVYLRPCLKRTVLRPGITAYTFNSSTLDTEAGSEFKASLVYLVSSRTTQGYIVRLCLKKKKARKRNTTLCFAISLGNCLYLSLPG